MNGKIKTLQQAEDFLFSLISKDPQVTYPGEKGIKKVKKLLQLFGNPQDKIKVIHIAGTSGKGSTATFLSCLLHSHHFKVGLTISPHLVDIRERFQINNTLLSEEIFCNYVNDVKQVIDTYALQEYPTYSQMLDILSFVIFYKEKVDYAVIETGMGGLLDTTNVVSSSNKLCVITRIGLDHTKILGNTFSKIACQKAGIIQQFNSVITFSQIKRVLNVFQKTTKTKKGRLFILKKNENYKNIHLLQEGIEFTFNWKGFVFLSLKLSSKALYQVENSSLALASLIFLSQRDLFSLDEKAVRKVFGKFIFTGRMQSIKYKGAEIILDGAHNPQKMRSFIYSLTYMYPQEKFHFLIAFKKGKESKAVLKILLPYAKSITVTTIFSHNSHLSFFSKQSQTIVNELEELGEKVSVVESSPQALNTMIKKGNKKIIVTGSLYLVGEMYGYLMGSNLQS